MPYTALTLAQLRTRLFDRVESKPFWVTEELDLAINESLRTWNMLTGRWHRRIVIETTANTYELALPTSLLYRTRFAFNGLPLSPSSRTDFNLGRPRWRQETTTSGGSVPSRPTLWAPVSLRLVYIWPMDASGHNSWTIDGVADTPVLTSGGDFVDLSEADVNLLLNYALHVLLLKKDGPWFTASLPYFKEFLAAAAEENALISLSSVYRQYMGLDHRDLKLLKPPRSAASQTPDAVTQ